ncbi:MAG: hypothetical protein J6X88_04545 [Bacteroidales bacterium]|nr:hypothetical protein [Bacteroidales bacterium]
MYRLLHKNSIAAGVLFAVASEALCALLVWGMLAIAGLDIESYARWFAVAFVPPLLLLRHYAREKEYPLTLRAVIVTFFVTFVAFMWAMIKHHYITFN